MARDGAVVVKVSENHHLIIEIFSPRHRSRSKWMRWAIPFPKSAARLRRLYLMRVVPFYIIPGWSEGDAHWAMVSTSRDKRHNDVATQSGWPRLDEVRAGGTSPYLDYLPTKVESV